MGVAEALSYTLLASSLVECWVMRDRFRMKEC